jgi:hypothetical protein
VPDLDLDWRLRLAAFDKLRALRVARGGGVTLAEPDPRHFLGSKYLEGFEETVRAVRNWVLHST